MSITSVISNIVTGAEKLWDNVAADIEADYAKVKTTLPASAQTALASTISDIKQGASDTLSLVNGSISAAAPALTKSLESALDTAMVTLTNGAAVPLVPLVNSGIDNLETVAVATVQAWILKQKAALVPAPAGEQQ